MTRVTPVSQQPAAGPPAGCPAHQGAAPPPEAVPLHGPDFAADPHAVYRRLRRYGPVAPVELAPGVRAHLVTDYRAALDVLRSPEAFAKDARRWRALADGRVTPDNPVVPMMAYRPNCLFTDGEAHRRLRQAVTDSLERIDPNALRGYVERSADVLVDRFTTAGEADLLGDYAKVLPLLVFNQLFGCPPALGDRLVEGMSGIFDGVDAERANALVTSTFTELIALKRRQPGADMTSWLMAHPAGLTDEEMIHQLVVLMGAGTEPQQNLIANALRLLLCDDRFAGDLAGGSMPVDDALDEVLWLDPPMANYGVHYPTADLDFAGVRLRAGEPVVVSFAAANTDPALRPDHHSGQRTGNRAHLAWSAGPHHCPAKDPARLIASAAVERLLDRLPDLELAVPADRLVWRPGPFHRALTALPVRFPPQPVPVPAAASAAASASAYVPGRRTGTAEGRPGGGPARSAPRPAATASVPGTASVPAVTPATAPLPAPTPETFGDRRWNVPPAPSRSTPPAGTSTARPPASGPTGRRSPWSSLGAWWRGR
ncbi:MULTISPECIES: cytochrome P450 [Streptomyces]|uniref:cytochrome P450 n=1 Tax=Streptomyces TaxID=1883 RepID=UPI001CCCD6F1|nr:MULTISPECIES: cytochrome P450 [Streptomyces]UBI36347.1 cytochrome P450 [Streptomyces mobaraensis]UKW28941.1 cytochrome P450 [Streptomyces sp. TYQ1024]